MNKRCLMCEVIHRNYRRFIPERLRKLTKPVVFAAVLLSSLVFAGTPPGPARVVFAWDGQGGVDVFRLYSSTNLLVPLTNWTALTNVPGTNFSCAVPVQPGQRFFYLTASNFWGESDPSAVASTPAVPAAGTNLSISRGW